MVLSEAETSDEDFTLVSGLKIALNGIDWMG